MGKKTKKIHAREIAKKKNSCKKEGKKVKKKSSCRRNVHVLLLWRDSIYLLGCCHPKNFAVLLWFAIIAFNESNCAKSDQVIFRCDLAAKLIFHNILSQRGYIARLHIIETSTSNEPVIGH